MRDFVLATTDLLIPRDLNGRYTRRQARRVLTFGLALLVWPPVFAPIYLLAGSPIGCLIIVIAFFAIVVSVMSVRYAGSVTLAGHLLSLSIVATMTGLATRTGGTGSPSLWWLVLAPIVALVTCSVRAGIGWAIISCIACLCFLANDYGEFFPLANDIAARQLNVINALATAGIILCAFSLTLAFKLSEDSARAELERARQESEAANQAKSQFLANMSHEIRTPMNHVLGLTELILESELPNDQRNDLETVLDSGQSLMALINEILDFSKIEAGKVELELTPLHLRAELRKLEASIAPRARSKQLDVQFIVHSNVPDMIYADPIRLRQVLLNLITNAIKFTRRGSVNVTVDCPSTYDEYAEIRFEIVDTGIGIASDKIDAIFSEFEQADASTTREFGGTGLGLAISSSLVRLMGGGIDVESVEGQGSTFGFTLTFKTVADEASGSLATESFERTAVHNQCAVASVVHSLNILLVEDGVTNQKLARLMLEKWGHAVTLAENGRIAIDLWKSGSFDLILMDIQMPELDGIGATKLIREHEQKTGGHIPIMAVTAHAMKGDRERCLDAGMDGYISKPIRRNELASAIEQLISETA